MLSLSCMFLFYDLTYHMIANVDVMNFIVSLYVAGLNHLKLHHMDKKVFNDYLIQK
jgi:hypothetical protein